MLPNSEYWKLCDSKILVKSDDMARKKKVLERDNISEDYFDKRDYASFDYSAVLFDNIFENDYQTETMDEMINRLCTLYIE